MFFDHVREGAPDAIFGMLGAFLADPRPEKINLMVGIYKDESLKSELIPVVREIKERLQDFAADYLPFEGVKELPELLAPLVFGKNLPHMYVAQSVGGTGALRVGAEFLAQEVSKRVYLPNPTWGNHRNIFERAGFTISNLPYYNHEKRSFDREAYIAALKVAEPMSVVIFHPTCHNPTGSDPSFEDWKEISSICQERRLFPFFDFAYQGFGDGLEEDAKVIRLFAERGHEMFVAYSCSKNFSLYCQRMGALFAVCKDAGAKFRVGSQIKRIIRAMYSNPPSHGARIVVEVLSHEKERWMEQVEAMRQRLTRARELLALRLGYRHLLQRKGMFLYLDLNQHQVQELIQKHAIYTLESGRISLAGLTPANTDIVAQKVKAVL